jgi:hypothetical protein
MDHKELVKTILKEHGNSLVPAFKPAVTNGFYMATGQNMNKVLYEMSEGENPEVIRDFVKFVPKGNIKPAEDGKISVNIGGRQVVRKQNPTTGEISEAIFYLRDGCPAWVLKRKEAQEESKSLSDKYKELLGETNEEVI